MATTGTVSQTIFQTQKVIDHAFRRCRLAPQQITSEHVQTALDLLYLFLSTLASKGIALWRIQKDILPLYPNVTTVPCPVGTVDLLNANLRTMQRVTGTYSASQGIAANAFDGDLETSCTQVSAAGSIQVQFESETQITTYGILPNATGVWDISLQVSDDGITWETVYTDAAFEAVNFEWKWIDLQGQQSHNYSRLKANGATVLNVREFVTANMPNEIPMYKMNRDDYSNLNNKTFPGRPTQFWYNKQREQPLIELWPTPAFQFTFSQIITYSQKYVEDVGTMTDTLDIPQRWFMAVVCNLAKEVARSVKEVDRNLVPELDQKADYELRIAWDSETDSSRSSFRPNLRPYTS